MNFTSNKSFFASFEPMRKTNRKINVYVKLWNDIQTKSTKKKEKKLFLFVLIENKNKIAPKTTYFVTQFCVICRLLRLAITFTVLSYTDVFNEENGFHHLGATIPGE